MYERLNLRKPHIDKAGWGFVKGQNLFLLAHFDGREGIAFLEERIQSYSFCKSEYITENTLLKLTSRQILVWPQKEGEISQIWICRIYLN